MRKIINGKVYDTDKAKFIHELSPSLIEAIYTIYKKRTGEYFIHSRVVLGQIYERIIPVDIDFVKDLLESYPDVYNSEFGITDKNVILSLSLSDENSKNLRQHASKYGLSISSVINGIISEYFEYRIEK